MLKIIILEDNEGRQTVMKDCLRDRFHQYELVLFNDAQEMVAFLNANLESALLIALDHDLEMLPQQDGKLRDPGTGRDVANFLAQHAPACPVVIHTTNSAAGDGMEFLLHDAGWKTYRVHPYGDLEWITEKWLRTLRDAIVAAAKPQTIEQIVLEPIKS